MSRIKIVYIITQFDLGGAQKSLLLIISALRKDKYEVSVACSKEGIILKDAQAIAGVKVEIIPSLNRGINPFYDLKALFDVYRLIKDKKADIVHTHSSKAGILGRWAARLAKVPILIHTIHGWEFHPSQNFLIRNFYVFLEKITAKITQKLIAVSNYDIEQGLKFGIGEQQKYTLIRYGIRRQDFADLQIDTEAKKRELGINSSPVVGMIACFKPQKSPQDFIKAASLVVREIPEAKFLLVGEGMLRNKLERLIKKLNLTRNVILLGWRRDIAELIQLFDILILTSRWEGLPVVFLEAMAAAKPIIATDICGNSEVIKDGKNGFLVPVGDYKILSQKIILLLKDRNLRTNMGKQGSEMLDGFFEVDYMVKRIEEVYQKRNGDTFCAIGDTFQ